ncbi:MAG TPA: hypothetical protein VF934_02710 [Burkholderiales bacterium]
MIDAAALVKYALAAVSVFLLGTAAGVFVNHAKSGLSYSIPIALAVCGFVAAAAAWNLHRRARQKGAGTQRESDKPGA